MQMLRKEKAPAALIPIMIGGSVGGREAAAVALANLAAGSKDTAVRKMTCTTKAQLITHLNYGAMLLMLIERPELCEAISSKLHCTGQSDSSRQWLLAPGGRILSASCGSACDACHL